MLRSMYSGISGLRNFQTKLDVIGNNISNVNTYGFKKGRVVFKDLISQTTAGASAPTDTRGGVNPKQVGLGSQMAAIDTIFGSGSLQSTFRTLDLAISGDGFFQVADSLNNLSGFTNIQYTRAGNFYMDRNGYLVNSDGKYLVGLAATIVQTQVTYNQLQFDASQNGDQAGTSYILNQNTNARIDINGSGDPTQALRVSGNRLVYGPANNPTALQVTAGGTNYDLQIDSTSGQLYINAGGTRVNLTANGADFVGDNTVTYNFVAVNGNNATFVQNNIQQSTVPVTRMIDNYVSDGATLRPIVIPTTAQSMSIGQDGTINFVDEYGNLQWAGQIQLAKFPNSGGLEKVGSNYYQATSNSGNPVLGFATENGMGSIESGFLEMSNVDLSEEFTEMIVAQRGFQANSRIITTSDEILQELVNLKR